MSHFIGMIYPIIASSSSSFFLFFFFATSEECLKYHLGMFAFLVDKVQSCNRAKVQVPKQETRDSTTGLGKKRIISQHAWA
jgi:hypothetical protein